VKPFREIWRAFLFYPSSNILQKYLCGIYFAALTWTSKTMIEDTSMKGLLLIIFIGLLGFSSTLDITEEICKMYDAGEYEKVTSKYGAQSAELPYKALFHLGLSYYKQGKDEHAIEIMEMCIKQQSKDSDPQYIKGKSLNFIKQYGKAIKAFNKAIAIDDDNGSYYTGLGDSYMSLNHLDKALEAYLKATKQEDCPIRPYHKIPLIYAAMGKNQLSLEAYYEARENLEEDSEDYRKVLFKIGQLETIELNNVEAKMALTELIELDPSNYQAYPLLIQTYMKLRKYEACEDLRKVLFKAYADGLLNQNLKDRFCFDLFDWDDKYSIKAYEQFDQNDGPKHVFEIKEKGTLVYTLRTIRQSDGESPYVLQKHINDKVFTYQVSFTEDSSYGDVKAAAMDVIMEKISPVDQ